MIYTLKLWLKMNVMIIRVLLSEFSKFEADTLIFEFGIQNTSFS